MHGSDGNLPEGRGDHGAGVDSDRNLRILPEPEKDPESELMNK